MKINIAQIKTIVALMLLSTSLFAADSSPNNDAELPASTFKCETPTLAESRFDDIQKLAKNLDNQLCQSLLKVEGDTFNFKQAILDFGDKSEQLLLKHFTDSDVQSAVTTQLGHFEKETLNLSGDMRNNNYTKMGTDLINQKLYFTIPGLPKGSKIADIYTDNCQKVTGDDSTTQPFDSCIHALEDAATAFNNYQVSVVRYQLDENVQKLDYLSSQWRSFLKTARSQTFLDVWLTTAIHDKYYSQEHLVPPASTQFFLLRPQVVYEVNKDAKKGDRNQIGLAAEWIGVNWWDLKIPLGVSAISVYADYEEEDSVGHGLLFTINNSASIGWVKRGDSGAVLFTMDFLKLWQDKSAKLDQYKQDPWAWIN